MGQHWNFAMLYVIVEVLVLDLRFFFISEHKCWRVEHKVYFLRDNNYQSYLGLGAKKFKISVTIESGILLCNSCHLGVHRTHSLIIKRDMKLEDSLNKYVSYQELSVAPNGLFWSNWFFWFRRRVIRCGEIIWGEQTKEDYSTYHAVEHEVKHCNELRKHSITHTLLSSIALSS